VVVLGADDSFRPCLTLDFVFLRVLFSTDFLILVVIICTARRSRCSSADFFAFRSLIASDFGVSICGWYEWKDVKSRLRGFKITSDISSGVTLSLMTANKPRFRKDSLH